jgi:hypothetical protein
VKELEGARTGGDSSIEDKGVVLGAATGGDLPRRPERIAAARQAVASLEEAERSATIARGYGPRAQLPGLPKLEKGLNKLYENPSLAIYKMQSSAYKYSWALIPLSVPLLWLLFPFSKRFHLYDHTVFVTYSLSFMTLLAVALGLLMGLGVPWIGLLALSGILPPIHMYRQLRGAYALSRLEAAWRAALLMLFATLAASAFGFLLLLLGALS